MASLLKNFSGLQLFSKYIKQSMGIVSVPNRGRKGNPPPRKRHPEWLPKPQHSLFNEELTDENKDFIKEIAEAKYGPQDIGLGMKVSILKDAPIEPITQWTPNSRRTGLIARKIGIYPMWLKNGKKVYSTLLQIVDNEVVKYIPPELFNPVVHSRHLHVKRKLGCLVIGSGKVDPQKITKEYAGIFNAAGVVPKQLLMRFVVSPDAALQPGTPLYAAHYKPGDVVDIRAKTIDRGFQGVMKRWGFKGMPASHGVTKTHRRPGNIGSGSKLGRVMPGTKMPGHMGNRWRVHRGIRILRINTKYNVIWILGHNLPGETNSYCYIYDTILPTKKYRTAPYFPTYLPGISEESIPEDLFADDLHSFNEPTIEFTPES